jgi:hypothetical protein
MSGEIVNSKQRFVIVAIFNWIDGGWRHYSIGCCCLLLPSVSKISGG